MTNIQAYQQSFLSLRKGSGLDFPIHVHIETQAICNAACNFCPYPRLERKGEVMPTSMFEKIVDDLTAIPRLHKFQLSLFKVNEPLMEPRLYQFLELIREKLPNAVPTITTNASLLTDEHIQNLSKHNQTAGRYSAVQNEQRRRRHKGRRSRLRRIEIYGNDKNIRIRNNQ